MQEPEPYYEVEKGRAVTLEDKKQDILLYL